MEPVFASVLMLASIHFAAMLSPGPTALVVLRHGTRQQVRSMTPLVSGIVAATVTNTFLTLVGVAAVIAASPRIALVLATLGSLYLLYLGGRNVLTAFQKFGAPAKSEAAGSIPTAEQCSPTAMFRDGYLINLLNPKIAVFYISIFAQVASPELPRSALAIFCGQLILQSLLFWSCFTALTRAGIVSRAIDKSNGWVDLFFGVALISFALYLFASGL